MTQLVASFRDPAGSCCLIDGRILRIVGKDSAATFETFLQTKSGLGFVDRRQLVSARRLEKAELAALRESSRMTGFLAAHPDAAVFEHERVWFPSYPYEWPPEMLWEAGRLTLDLALTALEDGYGLKDATPYNILYRGSEPIFIDVPSFEPRAPGDPVWNPYGQFVRTFLLPLLANRRWGVPLADIFTTHRDGLEPEDIYRWCGPLERFKPRMLSLVSMPTWLRGRARAEGGKLYESRTLANEEKARFIVESLLKQLRRSLDALQSRVRKESVWSDYMATHSYSEPAFAAKEQFVESLLREFEPSRVLDVGANTGHFSALAAKAGAEVVALDLDPACVGALWRRARSQKLNILPLVVDLSRPSPALGWRNSECPSFLDRAAGAFDAVLMLAVIHHLLVTERIPLEEILRQASELTTSLLIIEFVAPEDEMFRHLTRGREHLHASLTETIFERVCGEYFDIVKSVPLPGSRRRLYGLKRKGGSH
jgi:2-polyprenyl-3-methyl-5-hydroxy-6-metoxy-1,4-benzoquinol methylase